MLNYYYMATGYGQPPPIRDNSLSGEYQRPPNKGDGDGWGVVLLLLILVCLAWG